jgi:hypothetical protein
VPEVDRRKRTCYRTFLLGLHGVAIRGNPGFWHSHGCTKDEADAPAAAAVLGSVARGVVVCQNSIASTPAIMHPQLKRPRGSTSREVHQADPGGRPSRSSREVHPLAPELFPEEAVLRLQVVDLLLQNAAQPDRQPRCQKLQRQREHRPGRLGFRRSHEGARIGISNGPWSPRNRGEPLDIITIREDPLLAQDGLPPGPAPAPITRARVPNPGRQVFEVKARLLSQRTGP